MKITTTLNRLTCASLTLCLSACALEKADDASEYREAVPQANAVTVAGPDNAASGSRSQATRQTHAGLLAEGALGATEVAQWYAFTREVRDGVNQVTASILGSVWLIVHSNPSSVGDDFAEWGPHTDSLEPVTWRFRVDRMTDGEYDYRLEGRPRASRAEADFRVVLSGKGFGKLDSRHGAGTFIVDLEAARTLDPVKHRNDSGTVVITHDLPPNVDQNLGALPRTIHANLLPADQSWAKIVSVAKQDQTGTLRVEAHADADPSKTTALEDIVVDSRWLETGAGRADVTVSGGDLPASIAMVSASECWGTDFARAYYSDSVNLQSTFGDASACVYPAPASQ